MKMAIDCYRGTIFNWCDVVLANLKGQLTRVKNGQLKTFGYGPLVVSFALERVLMLIPQQLTVEAGLPREPKLMQWVAVMARHPHEGTEVVRFTPEYFRWLEDQVFSIQDFPYAGVDFRGDPDMVLPPGEQWDDIGNFIFHKFFFKLSIFFVCFNIVSKLIVIIFKMQM